MSYKYTFIGEVHPKRANFEVNARIVVQIKRPEFGIDGMATLEFKDSEFIAEYLTSVNHTQDEKANLETLKNCIEESIRLIVDTYCYIKSYNYDVEINKVTCLELNIDKAFTIQGEWNINKDKEQTDNELTNWMMFLSMRRDLEFLKNVLSDFRRSIKYPAETAAFCFRAVETIRRFYFEDMTIADEKKRRIVGWKLLRKELDFNRKFFKEIEKFAVPNRHGNYPVITYPEREKIMNKTRQVIDGFMRYVQQKKVEEIRERR